MRPDDLDELARSLPAHRPDPVRAERVRTAILAAAPGIAQARPRRRRPVVVAAAALSIAVAAAAIAIWAFAERGSGAVDRLTPSIARRGHVRPDSGADWSRATPAPDEIVRLREGAISIDVAALAAGERFRVVVGDAEIEVRGTSFDVAAHEDRLASVTVSRGTVEVRPTGRPVVVLAAGDRWPSERAAITPIGSNGTPPPQPPPPQPSQPPPPSLDRAVASHDPKRSARPQPVVSPPVAHGEAEFRAGWDALRAGDPALAARSFAAARRAAKGGAIAEDAHFWEAMSLGRAGRADAAIDSLAGFLEAYPRSSRAGEAAAKLGWLQLEAGDLDAAQRAFERATDDRVPKVRESARSGLQAVERRRAAD
jgi:TolA-binding protein